MVIQYDFLIICLYRTSKSTKYNNDDWNDVHLPNEQEVSEFMDKLQEVNTNYPQVKFDVQ